MGWVIRNFSRSSKLNYITNLIAHPRDFGHKIFDNGWGLVYRCLEYALESFAIPSATAKVFLFSKANLFKFHCNFSIISGVQKFRTLTVQTDYCNDPMFSDR